MELSKERQLQDQLLSQLFSQAQISSVMTGSASLPNMQAPGFVLPLDDSPARKLEKRPASGKLPMARSGNRTNSSAGRNRQTGQRSRPRTAGLVSSPIDHKTLPDVRILVPAGANSGGLMARPSTSAGYGSSRPASSGGRRGKKFPKFDAKEYQQYQLEKRAVVEKDRRERFSEHLKLGNTPAQITTPRSDDGKLDIKVNVPRSLYDPILYTQAQDRMRQKSEERRKRRNKHQLAFGVSSEREGTNTYSEATMGPAAYGIPNNPRRPIINGRAKGGIISKSYVPSDVDIIMKRASRLPSAASYAIELQDPRLMASPTNRIKGGSLPLDGVVSKAPLEGAATPGPADCQPKYGGSKLSRLGTKIGMSNAKNFLEQALYEKRDIPGPGEREPDQTASSFKTSGGKISEAKPKSDIEWAIYRAKQTPGPGEGQPDGGFSSMAHTSGGAFNTSQPKGMIDDQIYQHKDIPAPGDIEVQNLFDTHSYNAIYTEQAERQRVVLSKVKNAVKKLKSKKLALLAFGMKQGMPKKIEPEETEQKEKAEIQTGK